MVPVRRRRTSHVISFLIVSYLACLPSYAQYSGGRGTPEDPYQIATAENLMAMETAFPGSKKHFILTEDIDLFGYEFTQAVIPWFSGTFDGTLSP